MRLRSRLTGAVLAVLAGATVGGVAVTAPAHAADGCWGSGGAHTDYAGNTFGTRWCSAYRTGNVRANGATSGVLYAGTSWFVCQKRWPGYNNPKVGNAENNWWLYTQADTGKAPLHGWGWFPATHISGGQNWGPIPNLRTCDTMPAEPALTP